MHRRTSPGGRPLAAILFAAFLVLISGAAAAETAPPTGCTTYDLQAEFGPPGPGFATSLLGDAEPPILAERTFDGLNLTSLDSGLLDIGDNATFTYRSVEGAFRVVTPTPDPGTPFFSTDPHTEGGLMVRWGVETLAPRASLTYLPLAAGGPAVRFEVRAFLDADLIEVARVPLADIDQLALETAGTTVVALVSRDAGATFEVLGSHAIFPSSVSAFAGPVSVSASYDPGSQFQDPASYVFPFLQVCAPEVIEPPEPDCFEDDFEDGVIDPAWTLVGIGNANQVSADEIDDAGNGELALTADGATAFFGADNAGFLYQSVTGDFRLEATVDGTPMTTGGLYRKAGLMVRQSLDPWDVRLLAQLAPFWEDQDETHLQFVARDAFGQPGRLPVATDVIRGPRVVRLAIERDGDTLAVEYSYDDGATWIQPTTGLGGSITIPGLAPTLLVGLDMVSNDISTTSTALFDDASICPAP